MEALRKAGIRIPEDLSIVGTENLEGCGNYNLTSFETHIDVMCEKAFKMLIERKKGNKPKHPFELTTPELVERDSVRMEKL